ncbi:VOC family protein [Acaryochloris marina NIES-2412]|uniref:VOC family protein n=1 Tax=Acaryochloris marina TaxID=155978 RepID=UPI00405A2949
MKFKYTILYVKDVTSTLDFFKRAFGFDQQFLHESGDYGELSTGSTTLSFSAFNLMKDLGKSPAQAQAHAPVFEMAFESNDVRSDLARALEAGAVLQQDIREESWGQTTAYVIDPNGFLIEICSPVAS